MNARTPPPNHATTPRPVPPPMPLDGQRFPRMNLAQVTAFYEHLVERAISQLDSARFPEVMATMVEATKIAYLVNWRYGDSRLEDALARISTQLLPGAAQAPAGDERVVFFDSWGFDARGLSLQYIRALKAVGAPLLYICETRNDDASVRLRKELARAPAAEILYLAPGSDEAQKARAIHAAIDRFAPSRIFMHMNPWAVGAIAAFHAFPDVPKYQVNLTDHAFWLGAGCTDYCLEFRDYGRTITHERRAIALARTIMNPYYPVVDDSTQGELPARRSGETVIFTGGAFYKMYGRDGYFFDLIATLLEDHEHATVWIAGNGRATLLEKRLRPYLDTGRVKLIGNRKDINAVFKASDIYLSTYPVCGALMAQLATVNDKPILSFTSADLLPNFLEDIVGTAAVPQLTTTELGEFKRIAAVMIDDPAKRAELAGAAREAMHDRAAFESRVAALFSKADAAAPAPCERLDIDYDAITSLYLEIENDFQDELAKRLVRNTTLRTALRFPALTLKAAVHVGYFMILGRLGKG